MQDQNLIPPAPNFVIPSEHLGPGKPKKSFKMAAIIAVVLLFLAGSAFAGLTYIFPPPAKVLQQALTELNSIQSFDYSGKITVDISTESGDLFSFDTWLRKLEINTDPRIAGATNVQFGMDFSGTVDATDPANPKNELNIDLNSSIISLGIDTKFVDQILYLKIDNIPTFIPEASKYSDVWMKADLEEISEKYGIGIDLQNGQPDLTDGQKNELEELMNNSNFFNGVTKLGSDSIDGVGMHHYALTIDKQALKNYLESINSIIASGGGFTGTTSDVFDFVEFDDVEVWIGKSDKRLHRISAKIYEKPSAANTLPAAGSVNFLINLRNFNNPSPIEAPTESKNILDVINESLGSAQAESRDARRMADVRQLMTALELYYNDFGRYPRKLTDMQTYIAVPPTAPTPPDGDCTEPQNTYTYAQKSSGSNYSLTFCVGGEIGGFGAGVRTASSRGLE
jgi:hypothetical protein